LVAELKTNYQPNIPKLTNLSIFLKDLTHFRSPSKNYFPSQISTCNCEIVTVLPRILLWNFQRIFLNI
jgi:hypothetical protein